MRSFSCAIALLMLAGAFAPAVQAETAPAKPKLIVTLVVDQFADALYRRYRPTYTGGLKRLGDGVSFTGYQSHAATETCPGHSTILTGRHPAATGIVANSWFDVASGSTIYCVSVRGTADPDARGPQNLHVDTLGGWMRGVDPADRVVSISGKDRAAIMLAGQHPSAVYWWNDGVGFATSSYASPATPAVTAPAAAFDAKVAAAWRKAPPRLWPTDVSPACAALEQPATFGKLALSGHLPPDASTSVEDGPDFLARTDFQDQLRVSPTIDRLTLDFAADMIDRDHLGHGAGTDLLAVSLSATDYIGHRYGSGGPEMCVQMAALDAALGAFLAKLDSLHTPYVVVLTADHGGIDAAERAKTAGLDAMRIDPIAFVKALNDALKQQLSLSYDPVVGDDPQQLTINVGPDEALRTRVRDAALAWLRARPEVAEVHPAAETVAATVPAGTPVDKLTVVQRFHESYEAGRSGDIQVAFKPYSTIGLPRAVGDTVAGHGSPWDYDRRVPILFWWPGATPDRRAEPIETVDIAPTLAAIAGVPTPPVDGRCLPTVANCPAARPAS